MALNTWLNVLKQEGLPESQQMLLVLVSQGWKPTAASLTTPTAAPSQGKLAVQHLLEVVQPNASGMCCGTTTGPSHSWLSFEDGMLTLRLTTPQQQWWSWLVVTMIVARVEVVDPTSTSTHRGLHRG
ncbi:hypothetical protein EDB92DRAFT_1822289 [Lactarius akahatsu]|uniref:Uncharacterized protein n=1 Tax=Lactarius akahatsu TaxID=416441 RepID=A0AAD4Q754_9AGAM|nr:hypothetical protein EDB92DRAFT_1822289 [Lactarius akahatsu]